MLMQTFLPYADFTESAKVLDRQRLGKQRVEAWQVLRTLSGETKGWSNHPAVRHVRAGCESGLAVYGLAVCEEWISRGYKDSLLPRFADSVPRSGLILVPDWLTSAAVHLSHQSNLVRKDPAHYGPLFPDVPDDLPYVWPV
jgi:hypothetical protein